MKQFRTLKPDEIECRVAQCNEKGASILLYKTARTDADLLDETVGTQNWENDFKIVDGVLYGGIGVDYFSNGHLVWKWDAGVESNTEAEKGRASDAFKRAGFKHGIGRELYSAPFIWIGAENCSRLVKNERTGKWQCSDHFDVSEITYDEAEHIKTLTITSKGRTVYTFGHTTQNPTPKPASQQQKKQERQPGFKCADCGKPVEPSVFNGKSYSAWAIAENTTKKYGRCLCWDCYMKLVQGIGNG